MAKLRVDSRQLSAAYRADLRAAWETFARRYPSDIPYAFVLYGVEGHIRLIPTALTEQGLTTAATTYVKRGDYDTLDEARKALRYSVADSPFIHELERSIPSVDAIAEPHVASLGETEGYELLAKAAIDALKELDRQGVFGTGPGRERLLLAIITEDVEDDWILRSVRVLNPEHVVRQFEDGTRIEGHFATCDALAVSTDGHSLYGAGSSPNPEGKPGSNDEFSSEIVAYDLRCNRLSRRWTYAFPSFGDSCRSLLCAPDDQSLFAMRARYAGNSGSTVLMRFPHDVGESLAEVEVKGEPASFALSSDGERLALATRDRVLHLFDNSFRPLQRRALDVKPNGLCFLRSGELLVATDRAVLRLNWSDEGVMTVLSGPAFRLSADRAGRFLAVSRWFPLSGPERDKPCEFGIQVLDFSTLQQVRTISVAGHRAVAGTLSHDGRLLALGAAEIGTRRWLHVVFEVATGREVVRRKGDFVSELAFLRDNRTLAIPRNGFTTSEAIEFWSIETQEHSPHDSREV